MSRKRPHAGIVLASEECLASVYDEMIALCLEIAQGKSGSHLVRLALTFHPHLHFVDVLWCVFTPFFCVFTEVIGKKERCRTIFIDGSLTNTISCYINLILLLLLSTE